MHRRLLAMIMSLGLVVTAVGFSGIYAVLTDRAKTGDFNVNTGERARAADLKIAGAGAPGACPEENFVDNIEGPQFTLNNIQPNTSSGVSLCLWNAGSSPLEVHMLATDVTDVDTDCSNNEADFGDDSCGSDGAGELAPVIEAQPYPVDCDSPFTGEHSAVSIADLAAYVPQAGVFEDWDPGLLQPDEVVCLFMNIVYPAVGDGTTEAEAQLAQTDSLTWRLAFDGTLP
jgi:hypothetical protein